MDKFSELSHNARKAVNSFYNWSQLASCTSERVSCLTVEQLKETSELLSALLAENERVASDLVARNGEIEGLRKIAAELEAKLATPVRLPEKDDLRLAGDASTKVVIKFRNSAIDECAEALRAAGFTVEGDE